MATALTPSDELLDLDPAPYIYRFSLIELLKVAGVGAIVGILTPLLAGVLSRFVIEPFFCRNESSFSFCGEGGAIAFGVALILLSVAALLGLASLRTYQPLLNVVAALAALWGLNQYIQTIASNHRLEYYLLCVGLFAFAYGLFYLLLRFRNFAVSLLLVVVAVVLVRLQF